MAIWGTLAAGEFRLFDLTWLAAYPWLLNVMTHAGLALELELSGPGLGPAAPAAGPGGGRAACTSGSA